MLFRSRERKFRKILFEIGEFEIGTTKYASFLSEIQGTDSIVRNSESFEIAGVRNSAWVVPVYSGHSRDHRFLSAIANCPLYRVFFQKCSTGHETCF